MIWNKIKNLFYNKINFYNKMTSYAKELTERAEKVRDELIEHEKQFNIKKEEFFKIQGALEAIQQMASDS